MRENEMNDFEQASSAAPVDRRRAPRRLLVLAAAAATVCAAVAPAQANLLANGGFETGDLTGWTQAGDTLFNQVFCGGVGVAYQGACEFFAGPRTTSTLSQSFATLPGSNYVVTFALDLDGAIPSNFSAVLNGTPLVSLTNPADAPYALYSYFVTATGTTSTLTFAFSDPNGFYRLDAVAVDLPEPASAALVALGLAGLYPGRRRKA